MGRRAGLVAGGLVALAILEIVGFVLVAHWIGVGWTILLVLATSLLGSWLLRREGLRAWRAFRAVAESGRPPGAEVSRGLLGLGGALLLAVPGFLTDLVGLALLLPPVRAAAGMGVQRAVQRRVPSAVAGDLFGPRRVKVHPGATTTTGSDVVEGEVIDPR